jgi:hypothetical protein
VAEIDRRRTSGMSACRLVVQAVVPNVVCLAAPKGARSSSSGRSAAPAGRHSDSRKRRSSKYAGQGRQFLCSERRRNVAQVRREAQVAQSIQAFLEFWCVATIS